MTGEPGTRRGRCSERRAARLVLGRRELAVPLRRVEADDDRWGPGRLQRAGLNDGVQGPKGDTGDAGATGSQGPQARRATPARPAGRPAGSEGRHRRGRGDRVRGCPGPEGRHRRTAHRPAGSEGRHRRNRRDGRTPARRAQGPQARQGPAGPAVSTSTGYVCVNPSGVMKWSNDGTCGNNETKYELYVAQ